MSLAASSLSTVGFQALHLGTAQHVTVSGSSTQSAAFQVSTTIFWLFSTVDAFIQIGSNPTASSSTHFLPGGIRCAFANPPASGFKIAIIQKTSGGDLYITEGA